MAQGVFQKKVPLFIQTSFLAFFRKTPCAILVFLRSEGWFLKDIVKQKTEQTFRIDFLVEEQVIIELKAVEKILPVHEAQIRSYLRLMNKPIGLLINFNVPVLKEGIRRYVYQWKAC